MNSQPQKTKFDRKTWQRFVRLAKPFVVQELRWKARGLLLLLGILSISISLLNVWISFINRYLLTAIQNKDTDQFARQLYLCLTAFACATVVVVCYRYTEERLGLLWRRWLSLKIIRSYFHNRAYYKLNFYEGIDNPDQRIEEDTRTFTTSTLSFLLIIFNSLIAIFAFTGILWTISFTLVIAAVVYAILGSVATYLLGRPLIGLNFQQLQKEADYRYKLIKVRDNSESISFLSGESKEVTRVRQRLKITLRNLRQIIDRNRNLNFFTQGYNYVVSIPPTIIVASLYFNGKFNLTEVLGVVAQANFAFANVVNALSIIVLNFGSLSTFAAVTNRLGSFNDALDAVSSEVPLVSPVMRTIEERRVEFQDVSLYTPDGKRELVKELTIRVDSPHSLLITGQSGSGKSSLMRALSGLWTTGRGTIVRPPLHECAFLPQHPYMVIGTFRNQLLYPTNPKGVLDKDLMKVLALVKLERAFDRVGGFEAIRDWPNMLSTGEQQRLALARILLTRPRYVFLDEATTALNATGEAEMYRLIKEFAEMVVSVGYRTTLSKFHDTALILSGSGDWKIEKLIKPEEEEIERD